MKVLLYTEGLKAIGKSGLGKAVSHQIKALEDNNIPYTLDPKDKDYDIVHINFYGLKSYFLAKKAKKMGKKVVYHAHSTEEDFRNSFIFSNLVSPLFKKWICKCYRLGDHIITPTEYSKKILLGYNLDRPITAISNGIDMNFFTHSNTDGKKFRETYGFTDNDKVVIGIGLYLERKGILTFVNMALANPDYKFIWFGHSPLAFSPKKVKKAVRTKLDNLTFAGYVERDMIHSAFSGCDCYVFPTLEETEGIPILEGLSEKSNIIVRDIPIFDFLTDGVDVYKASNDLEFSNKLRDLLSGNIPSLKGNGYEKVKEMEIKTVGKKLISVYEEVLSEK